MDYLNCYICNSETKLPNSVRIRTKTKYSGIGVNEIIQSFLKESQVLRFSPNDIVCEKCFKKVNQYDLACRMADEIQRDVTNALYATEQEYLITDEPIEYLEEAQSDKNIYQKDFDEFQEQYDSKNTGGKEESVSAANIDIPIVEEDSLAASSKPSEDDASLKRNHYTGCEECDISFSTKKELKQHQLRYHTPKKCGVCQMMCANQMELKNHARQNHEIEQCSNDEAEMSRDMPTSETEVTFRCELCGVAESSAESLEEHVTLHENQLKCVICGTILKHKANLVLHMRIHADKKFFKCDKCGKKFVHKSSLRMHLQTTHTDVRNKQCPKCPLKFKTTSQLNQHLVTHSGIKKHQCPECGKAFGQKYNMTAHYKSHLGTKFQRKSKPKTEPESTSQKSEL